MEKDTQDFSLGIIRKNEDELIEILNKDDYNYLNFIAECIEELSKREAGQENCSSAVAAVTEKTKIYKYYTETASTAVEGHFSRSLQPEDSQSLVKMAETNMQEREASVKKTGAAKRKAKRKPTVTSLLPCRTQVTTDARVHPYTFKQPPACRPQPSPLLPATKLEMIGGPYYMTSLPPQQYCIQYQQTNNCYIKSEKSHNDGHRQPVYAAYCNGNTLVEVYSPTVGRGFNPRYNSLLVEPTVQPFLPHINGRPKTVSVTMANVRTFHHMAIDFNIPS